MIPPGYVYIRHAAGRRMEVRPRLVGRGTEGTPWPQTPPQPPPHPQPKRAVPREFSMWTLPSWMAPSLLLLGAVNHCAWYWHWI